MVFQIQDLALVPALDVADNLFLGREIFKKILGKYEVKWLLDRKSMRDHCEPSNGGYFSHSRP